MDSETFETTDLQISYVEDFKYLSISPKGDAVLKFKDLTTILYGNSANDPNVCATGFTWKVKETPIDSDQHMQFVLEPVIADSHYADLVVDVKLISNDGIVNVNITRKEWTHFIPQDVMSYGRLYKVTKKLSSFFTATQNPFSYTIFAEGDPTQVLYTSDATKLMVSKYFVMDKGTFSLNAANNYPLMGMGERAGTFYYDKSESGTYTRFTRGAPSPIDNGKAPGKNYYGVQPFYAYQSDTK